MEIWKEVKGYEGYYEVSNLGRVKSTRFKKVRLLKSPVNGSGYPQVGLSIKGNTKYFYVHKLVAMTFLNHKPNDNSLVIDHIDNDKLNNKISNLQLITHRLNASKDRNGGTSKYVGVCWSKASSKWGASITINGRQKNLGVFSCELKAAYVYNKALKNIKF